MTLFNKFFSMQINYCLFYIVLFCDIWPVLLKEHEAFKVWGPGLQPDRIIMPARYFFVRATNKLDRFSIKVEGNATDGFRPCRVWTNILDRKDGSYIVRYKMYEPCINFKISVLPDLGNTQPGEYYSFDGVIYSDDCSCPKKDIGNFLETWECGSVPNQIVSDLQPFSSVDWAGMRHQVIDEYNRPEAISLCHYIVKNNNIYRTCYGKYTGFKMFMDSTLLFLTRKTVLPDLEFFVNLGDWPLVKKSLSKKYPIFSWCGSQDTLDVVMPTYDITESALENMGRVTLDMLSVQGNVRYEWSKRIPKVFWRGRDSNKYRLKLMDISKEYPDLFNVSLTNYFFFRDQEHKYGPKTPHISFFEFFDFKYQASIDGTVAAYRLPYLLAGGSLLFKQDSIYYEHFYGDLQDGEHFISTKKDLSDLVDKIKWALEHDEEAEEIAKRGRAFANQHLLPKEIFCYHAHLLNEFKKRLQSPVEVLEGMELVEGDKKSKTNCNCVRIKEEL